RGGCPPLPGVRQTSLAKLESRLKPALQSRRLLLRLAADVQVAGARLEVAAAAFLGSRRRFLLERLQVGQVGHAVRAADRVQVEVDIILRPLVEDLEKIAAQLLARRAGQALAPPDGAEGMIAAVPLLHGLPQDPAQRLGVTQCLLDAGRLGVA